MEVICFLEEISTSAPKNFNHKKGLAIESFFISLQSYKPVSRTIATSFIIISAIYSAKNATIGERSIIPIFGNKRRNGANYGSASS